MPPTDLVVQRGHSVQTMIDDRSCLCSASPCCAVVAQTSHSYLTLAGRGVKRGDHRIKHSHGNIHTGALEPAAPGQLNAAHHSMRVCISQVPTMLAGDQQGPLVAGVMVERRQCVRFPSV